MADFIIGVTREEYQRKLDNLQNCMGDLESIRTQYVGLLDSLDDVMSQTDAQFSRLENLATQNINACETSIKNCAKKQETVQEALNNLNELGDNAKNFISTGVEAATETITAATKTAALF